MRHQTQPPPTFETLVSDLFDKQPSVREPFTVEVADIPSQVMFGVCDYDAAGDEGSMRPRGDKAVVAATIGGRYLVVARMLGRSSGAPLPISSWDNLHIGRAMLVGKPSVWENDDQSFENSGLYSHADIGEMTLILTQLSDVGVADPRHVSEAHNYLNTILHFGRKFPDPWLQRGAEYVANHPPIVG